MNERIEELVEQAGFGSYAEIPDTYIVHKNDLVEYTELIVRECLFIIDDERKPEMVSRIELWKQIVEHFGVEE